MKISKIVFPKYKKCKIKKQKIKNEKVKSSSTF